MPFQALKNLNTVIALELLIISIDVSELSAHSHHNIQTRACLHSEYQKKKYSNKWWKQMQEGIHAAEDE